MAGWRRRGTKPGRDAAFAALRGFAAGAGSRGACDRAGLECSSYFQTGPYRPRVVPCLDTEERSLFATRSPARPNPIGISCVRLRDVDAVRGVLRVEAVDLLDVKPCVPRFDAFPDAPAGWLDDAPGGRTRVDDRFE